MGDVTGERRNLRNEELRDLYSSLGIIRIIRSTKMQWAWHVARIGKRGKPEELRPLGRPRRRWVDNIKMDLLEIG
jgi:hypothetical protein